MLKDLKVWTAPSLDKSQQFTFEVSEKLDGTSLTAFVCNGDEGICSRNLRVPLHPEPGEPDNVYSHLARRDDLIGKLRSLNRNIAAQGELLGPSIQENKYNLTDTRFYCFDLYDIDRARYIDPAARRQLCQQIGLTTIPLVDEDRLGYRTFPTISACTAWLTGQLIVCICMYVSIICVFVYIYRMTYLPIYCMYVYE